MLKPSSEKSFLFRYFSDDELDAKKELLGDIGLDNASTLRLAQSEDKSRFKIEDPQYMNMVVYFYSQLPLDDTFSLLSMCLDLSNSLFGQRVYEELFVKRDNAQFRKEMVKVLVNKRSELEEIPLDQNDSFLTFLPILKTLDFNAVKDLLDPTDKSISNNCTFYALIQYLVGLPVDQICSWLSKHSRSAIKDVSGRDAVPTSTEDPKIRFKMLFILLLAGDTKFALPELSKLSQNDLKQIYEDDGIRMYKEIQAYK